MPSQTDLLNDALSQIGASPITAIDDGSTNANYCQRFYPQLLESMIRAHHWNFAMARVQLAQVTPVPVFEFAYAYALPSDLLKIVEYSGADPNTTTLSLVDETFIVPSVWRIEGRTLVTNDGTVKIVYLKRATDPNVWDGMFYQAMAASLASKLALAISKDGKQSVALSQLAQGLWADARASDGQEGSIQRMHVNDLIWGR